MTDVAPRGMDQLHRWVAARIARATPHPSGTRAGPVRILDQVGVLDYVLVFACRPGNSDLVLIGARRTRDGLAEVDPTEVVAALATRSSWPTHSGGSLDWTGTRPAAGPVAPVPTRSSNAVARVGSGADRAVLKVLRCVGADHEAPALTSLAKTGMVPRVFGRLHYRRPAAGSTSVVALLLEEIPGETLDVPLRRSLMCNWRHGSCAGSAVGEALAAVVHDAVSALHRTWSSRSVAPVARTDAVYRKIAAVRAAGLHGRGGGARVLDRAERAVGMLAKQAGGTAVGHSHGDMHLSNVMVDWHRVRFIDFGTSSAAGSPDDDFAALRRGVECMRLDVLIDDCAGDATRADDIAAQLRVLALTGDLPAGAGKPVHSLLDAVCRTGAWESCVVAALVGECDRPSHALSHLARLIHDLHYHTERDRRYHADLAWWQLAAAVAGVDGRAGQC
jgi:hypothetical protein